MLSTTIGYFGFALLFFFFFKLNSPLFHLPGYLFAICICVCIYMHVYVCEAPRKKVETAASNLELFLTFDRDLMAV